MSIWPSTWQTIADKLEKIKAKLSRNRRKEPLFDTPRFVRNLEKAYQEMWRIFIKGGEPRQIEVIEDAVKPDDA